MTHRAGLLAAVAAIFLLALTAGAQAHPEATYQEPPNLRPERALEPPLLATPKAECGPGSLPETDIQGRVPRSDIESGRAAKGYRCNTELVGAYEKPDTRGSVGGFKVERYTDDAGHDCAYFDSTLLYPTNLLDTESGVNVLDMSDPKQPKLTERLLTPAMQSPHESLLVNKKRGLLAAVLGNPTFYPGMIDIYDISADCRHPALKTSAPTGILGHESGWAPDGDTFYSASPGTDTLVALDVSNPSAPVPLWIGPYDSHGLSISDDGNRAYVAGINSGLIILDVSEVQARVSEPQVREVARLTWKSMSIPQNAIPITIKGHPYLVEIDEFGTLEAVGAGRIIDIADEANPRVVSNLRLEVHQPDNFDAISGDPNAGHQLQGYAGHYCNVPRRTDPGIVACSMISSGLRVFDIRDPLHPREIAYYNAPVKSRLTPEPFEASNYAMSSPSFVPERGEIWYSDGFQGFYAVRLTNGVWPFPKCKGSEETIPVRGGKAKGTKGNDVFGGTKGKDRVSGKGGRDKVCGRAGKDRLKGGPGRDYLRGGDGNDRVVGGPGRDRVDCGRGRRDVAVLSRTDRERRCERVKY